MENFLSDADFGKFRDLIYNESGIHFSTSNRTILESRLKEKLRTGEVDSIDKYYSLIKSNKEELKTLLDSVTTNLTRFFRNTAHFNTLEHYIIPDLIKEKHAAGEKTIKIWCAGCSTGEEPYSIAMIMTELLPSELNVEITASDLSLKSLMTAKEGYYPQTRTTGIPENYLSKYFEKKDNGYQIIKTIQDKIKFDYHNLKFDSGQRNLDLILCRNVIIYFDDIAQENVINKFWDALNNHSYLIIGHSESLFGMDVKFEFLKTDWACVYRKFN